MPHRKILEPWERTYYNILQRVRNYVKSDRHERYYGKVKMLITREELKALWFRDKGFLLSKPSIDRIDSKGHYELSNCRYIEMVYNSVLGGMSQRKPVRQLEMDGTFIRRFESRRAAVRSMGLPASRVCQIAKVANGSENGMHKSYRGFRWENEKKV